ncbi:hypothetical protein J3R83DRAFT_5391 [Lanmaoa asiatica]|nr:hypothetical protein J3R83DRAFT_5391 [Lanmaoa asiatica]
MFQLDSGIAILTKYRGGWDWMLTTMHANEAWKLQRKIFAQHLNSKAIQVFKDVLCTQAEKLAQRLMVTPHKFRDHTSM